MEKTEVWNRLDYGPRPDSDQTAIDYYLTKRESIVTDGHTSYIRNSAHENWSKSCARQNGFFLNPQNYFFFNNTSWQELKLFYTYAECLKTFFIQRV